MPRTADPMDIYMVYYVVRDRMHEIPVAVLLLKYSKWLKVIYNCLANSTVSGI